MAQTLAAGDAKHEREQPAHDGDLTDPEREPPFESLDSRLMDLANQRHAQPAELLRETALESIGSHVQHAIPFFRAYGIDQFQQAECRFMAKAISEGRRDTIRTH